MPKTVLFVCIHNAGRSVMAQSFFNRFNANQDWVAKSAGTTPKSQVNPVVVLAMAEIGFDVSGHVPHLLTVADVKVAEKIFTMGCTDGCPVTPPEKTEDWRLDDPAGKPIEEVRKIRDEVERRVLALIDSLA